MKLYQAFALILAILGASLHAEDAKPKPYTGELRFLERKQKSLFLKFTARNGGEIQIQQKRMATPEKTESVKVGETFADGHFLLSKVEEKEGMTPDQELVDLTELTIHDIGNGRSFVLVYQEELNWPDYYAELQWSKDENSPIFYVKEGDQFESMEDGGLIYEMVRVKEDELVLRPDGGESLLLKRAKRSD